MLQIALRPLFASEKLVLAYKIPARIRTNHFGRSHTFYMVPNAGFINKTVTSVQAQLYIRSLKPLYGTFADTNNILWNGAHISTVAYGVFHDNSKTCSD